FSFDQLYWGNIQHLQSVYRLSEYLSERHITYDLVPLSKMTEQRLARYRTVIAPHVEYMSGASRTALERYAAGGGLWLDIGVSGRFDDAGQVRARPGPIDAAADSGKGRFIRRADLEDLMDPRRFALYLLRENAMEDLPGLAALLKTKLGGENPFPPSRKKEDLRDLLNRNHAGVLPVVEGSGLEGLRTNVWRRRESDGETIAVHFVNYNCPIPTKTRPGIGVVSEQPEKELEPKILRDIAARVRVPLGKVTSARVFDPDRGEPETLEFRQQPQSVEFTLAELRIYKVVQLRVSNRAAAASRP
ncbi:MAG: beta-galactosidase trimerization domain-containing protein, partial [Acidobacteria bacterium]|nr:beta-galactosidase trimerization domain-containing protein [Acidobacteriota bacterium]